MTNNPIVILLLWGVAVTGLQLLVQDEIIVEASYQLSVQGSVGKVRYEGVAFPEGIDLSNERLVVHNAREGRYLLKIKATDNTSTDQKIMIINIPEQNGSETQNKETAVQDIVSSLNQHLALTKTEHPQVKYLLKAQQQLDAGLEELMEIARNSTISKNTMERNLKSLEKILLQLNAALSLKKSQLMEIEQNQQTILNSINQNQNKINQLEQELSEVPVLDNDQLEMLEAALDIAEESLEQILLDIQKNAYSLNQLGQILEEEQRQCQSLTQKHASVSSTLQANSKNYSILSTYIQSAVSEVQINTQAVEELKKELSIAESKLSTSIHILNYLQEEQATLQHQIADNNFTLKKLEENHTKCIELQNQTEQKVKMKEKEINEALRIKKIQIEQQIKKIKASLQNIEEHPGPITSNYNPQMEQQLQSAKLLQQNLKEEKQNLGKQMEKIRKNIDFTIDKMQLGKQNILTYFELYERQQAIQGRATQQFQRFTAEKEKITQIIAEKQLPYKINSQGNYVIEDWKIYLDDLYGFPTTQVPIKTKITSLYLKSSPECKVQENNIQFVGYIIQTFPDKLHIITNRGTYYLLFLTACTASYSNIQPYFSRMGDMLVGKGFLKNQSIEGSHLTFIRQ